MRWVQAVLGVAVLSLMVAGTTWADERGDFVLTLGNDTTSVEHYARGKDRLDVDQVGRSPRVLRRKFIYHYKDGSLTTFSMVVTPPGAEMPTQMIEAERDGDSLRVKTQTGTAAPARSAIAFPAGALLVPGSSPWAVYEGEVQRLSRSKVDSLGGAVFYLGASNLERYLVRRLGQDSVSLWVSRGDLFHIRVDKAGHLLGSLPVAGTFRVALSRPASLDLDAMAAGYHAREQAGGSLGMLSPRDTLRATLAGGGSLVLDYGRPAKRGRVVFGGLVPYGEVWRTGANAATQLRVDRPLEIGGNAVPAGAYTIWTIPGASGWKFVLNSETGQWGTSHKADRDLFSTDMKLSTLSQAVERFTITVEESPTGGVLHMDWDTTRASIEFAVKQP